MDRDQALRHRHLGEVADATQVVGLAEGQDAAAHLASPLDRHLHRLHAHDLSVATLSVERQQAAGVELHFDARIRLEPALQHGVHITRDHAHAVRVMAAEIGQHQVGRHLPGFFRRTAGRSQNGGTAVAQVLRRH